MQCRKACREFPEPVDRHTACLTVQEDYACREFPEPVGCHTSVLDAQHFPGTGDLRELCHCTMSFQCFLRSFPKHAAKEGGLPVVGGHPCAGLKGSSLFSLSLGTTDLCLGWYSSCSGYNLLFPCLFVSAHSLTGERTCF